MSERKDSGATASSSTARPSLKQSLGLDRHPLTPLKIGLLVAAGVMMALGAVLAFSGGSPAPDTAAAPPAVTTPDGAGGSASDLLGSGFAESRPIPGTNPPAGQPDAAAPADDGSLGLNDLSPFMLKGGFGLFIGFSIGFAIRAFLRLGAVVAGFYLLVLTMMAYAGWVDIHWDVMSRQFSGLLSSLGAQFESFKTFLSGAIPASGLTLAGLAVGLRRK